jgi:hypothetical protein
VFVILNYVCAIPTLVSVGLFTLYHLNALATNTTTIERWEKDKAATLVRRGALTEVRFPYDLGRAANVRAVLGPQPARWCWPAAPAPGDGTRFALGFQAGDGAWPAAQAPSRRGWRAAEV